MLFIHTGSLNDGPFLLGYMGQQACDPSIKADGEKYTLCNLEGVHLCDFLMSKKLYSVQATAGKAIYEGTFKECVERMLELLPRLNNTINAFIDEKKTHE